MKGRMAGNGRVLDDIVELWNKMTDAEIEHEAHMVNNVGMCPKACDVPSCVCNRASA